MIFDKIITLIYLQVEIFNNKMSHHEAFNPVKTVLFSIEKFTEPLEARLKVELKKSEKIAGEITVAERQMIVKAMGFKQGHWYKCPNGHPYTIADCGGAVHLARCPECNATIGGEQHRLVAGNSVATEMDGATRPAWPQ